MCLFQTVHHQMVCHLQCTCFRQFATRWCVICNVPISDSSPPDGVICNVPISDSSPPDGVSSAMCLFQTVYHQMVCHLLMCLFQTVLHQMMCHLQCVCFRPFTAKRSVIFNVPVSAARRFFTRWCVISNVPDSGGSPPDGVIFNVPVSVERQFITRWCVIFSVPVSAPKTVHHQIACHSPPDGVSSSMYLFQPVHHRIVCHLQCTCFSTQDGSPPDSVPVQQRPAAFRKSRDFTYGQELDGLRTALHPSRALLAVQLPLRHHSASGRGRQLQFIPGRALGHWLRWGLCLERV